MGGLRTEEHHPGPHSRARLASEIACPQVVARVGRIPIKSRERHFPAQRDSKSQSLTQFLKVFTSSCLVQYAESEVLVDEKPEPALPGALIGTFVGERQGNWSAPHLTPPGC